MDWWENESILPFRTPTTCMVSGATMSGKTHFIYRILLNAIGMFEIPPQKIIYCYSQYQPLFEEMERNITSLVLYQGLSSKEQIEKWTEGIKHTPVILDDLMTQVAKSEETVAVFSITAHHKNCTVFFLTQNLFFQSKNFRSLSLNCHYVVLFRSLRDSWQILSFGAQVYPGQSSFFKDAYQKATSKSYGYLLVDMNPASHDKYRLRTHIFPQEETLIYLPKE